jgi:hypothetical protein
VDDHDPGAVEFDLDLLRQEPPELPFFDVAVHHVDRALAERLDLAQDGDQAVPRARSMKGPSSSATEAAVESGVSEGLVM